MTAIITIYLRYSENEHKLGETSFRGTTDVKKSNLFYQSRQRRPEVDRAEGIYIWGKNGQRYIDGSSGAMVSNICLLYTSDAADDPTLV